MVTAVLVPCSCMAANRYVRVGATGTGSGNDWTNAYATLPSTLTRGGHLLHSRRNYGGYTFDDAPSGTSAITIKKATVADHGTSTGWSDTFGDGTAIFTGVLRFLTDDWVLDGQGRDTDWKSGYGFQIDTPTGDAVEIGRPFSIQVDNITIKYVDLIGSGSDPSIGSPDPMNDRQVRIACGTTCTGSSNIYIGYSYIHESGNVFLHAFSTDRLTIEYTWFARNNSTSAVHGEGIVVTEGVNQFTYRYNVMEDVEGTAYIATPTGDHPGCNGAINSNWYFYGNVFMKPQSPRRDSTGGGLLYIFDHRHQGDFVFSQNTIIGLDRGSVRFDSSASSPACSQSMTAQNNLFYNIQEDGIDLRNVTSPTVSHNAYFNSPNSISGANTYTASGNPLMNWVGGNFNLAPSVASAMTAGASTSTPYNIDPTGLTRGADGKLDRGAYEFSSGALPVPPAPPTNLTLIIR